MAQYILKNNDISFSLKNRRKKYHYSSINEAFDFNNISDNSDSDESIVNKNILNDIYTKISEENFKKGIKYFRMILEYKFNFPTYLINNINFLSERLKKAYVITYNCNFIKHAYDWKEVKNMQEYENLFHDYCGFNYNYKEYSAIISPDEGLIYFYKKEASAFELTFICYTGKVNYCEKINKKEKAVIDLPKFIWELLIKKNTESSLNTFINHGFSIIYDREGFPYLITVIMYHNLYSNLPNIFYKNNDITQKYWKNAIKSKHPSVKVRRDSKDGLLEFGVFFPIKLENILKNKPFRIYNRYYVTNSSITLSDIDYDDNGTIAIRLTSLGKSIYNQCKEELNITGKISKKRIEEIINENINL